MVHSVAISVKCVQFLTCMLAPGPGAPMKIQARLSSEEPGGRKEGAEKCFRSSSPM